jgi:hypothetical protein
MGPSIVGTTRVYRELAEMPVEPPDPELLVAREFTRRSLRVVVALAATLLLSVTGTSLLGYVCVRALFLDGVGSYFLEATAAFVFTAALFGAQAAARTLANQIIAARKDHWLTELCTKHGCDFDVMKEFVQAL